MAGCVDGWMDGGVSSTGSGSGRTIRSQSTIVHRMGLGWDEGFQNSGALDEEEDEDSSEGTLLTTQHGQATRIGAEEVVQIVVESQSSMQPFIHSPLNSSGYMLP